MPNLTMHTLHVAKRSLHRLVAIALGVGATLYLAQPSLAQFNNNNQPLQEFKPQEQNRDPFSSTNNGQSTGMMELIHRANLGNLRSLGEFNEAQQENINDEAAKFRAQQLQRLRAQPQPEAPAVPAAATPVTPGN